MNAPALALVGCVGQLALALLVYVRGRKNPIALPLSLLCLDVFIWNFAAIAHEVSGEATWQYLDTTASPFTPPLTLHVILIFVGKSRSLRWTLYMAYGLFGLISLSSVVAAVVPEWRYFPGSDEWSAVYLTPLAVLIVLSLTLLVQHWLRSAPGPERARAGLLLLAAGIAGLIGPTNLLADAGVDMPRLSRIGILLITILVALVALRFRLLDLTFPWRLVAASLAAGVAVVVAHLILFESLETRAALLVVATESITLVVLAVAYQGVRRYSENTRRVANLATLGRLSAQMAHDLKNPLAAMKGAVQLIDDENDSVSIGEVREFVEILDEEVGRMERLIESYRRFATVKPKLEPADLNSLVENLVKQQSVGLPDNLALVESLAPRLPQCEMDPDLMARVVENLIRNAVEAMPDGGTVKISTARDGPRLRMEVTDDGSGIDARTLERIFDDFYTTKTRGSGIGLPFVKRVVEAHDGTIDVASEKGSGTTVTMTLPRAF